MQTAGSKAAVTTLLAGFLACGAQAVAAEASEQPPASPLVYIDTGFGNASPLHWEVDASGDVHVHLVYDQERASPNRANGHWHFLVEAKKGSELTFVLHTFDNIWNGKKGSPVSEGTVCRVSPDGKNWAFVETEVVVSDDGTCLRFQVLMEEEKLHVAHLEPYTIQDLEALIESIAEHPAVKTFSIGKTAEGRDLEMIRVGDPGAPRHVLIRARAHPWESGGNWVVQGLIHSLLRDNPVAVRCRKAYCLHVLPMANKDGVARGKTRFNARGMDLNRKWGRPADARLAPENRALELWIEERARSGRRLDLAIDLHNDQGGRIHVSRPEGDFDRYVSNMQRLERLLMEETWFTEGSTGSGFRNPGTFGEGLLARYGIDAIVMELNVNWIAGLGKVPAGSDWEVLGAGMAEVFFRYFAPPGQGAKPTGANRSNSGKESAQP